MIPWQTLILGVFGLGAVLIAWLAHRSHLRFKLRQMAHEERLAALHKHPELVQEVLRTMQAPTLSTADSPDHQLLRMRSFSLVTGLVFLFGGAGILAGLIISPRESLNSVWSLGLIPILIGVGLLLYVVLSAYWQPRPIHAKRPTATDT